MPDIFTLRAVAPLTVENGQKYILAGPSFQDRRPDVLTAEAPLPGIRAGDILSVPGGQPCFRALARMVWPGVDNAPSPFVHLVEATAPFTITKGRAELAVSSCGMTLAWITMSDKGSKGLREDAAGPLIAAIIGARLKLGYVRGHVIPDEVPTLRAMLTDLALVQGFDLIVTTGGTGVAPRDVTPEATLAVIDKRLPGFEAAMLAASLAKTPHGAISRAVAGTIGPSLVINLPGSPKAVRENLEPLLPTLKHTLEKLQGDPRDCAVLTK
jgi:molybdopterin adenylyltransferase